MPALTILVGVILSVLGIYGYIATDRASVTALIPTFFGIPMILLGFWARNADKRKLAMHLAVLLGVLGLAGTVPGLLKIGTVLDDSAERPEAIIVQSAMAIVCLIYVLLCIRSFMSARKS